MLGELIAAFEAARDDEDVRVVVLTSRTRRSSPPAPTSRGFAADVPLGPPAPRERALPEPVPADRELGKPTICAANGHVLAGALGIALACDLIIAKDSAGFGTPEINVGAFPFMIMALIYRNVPRKKTNELLLLGERIDAPTRRARPGS